MFKKLKQENLISSAKIHYKGMKNDFLPGFGVEFLEILHERLILQPEVICLGSFNKKILSGFILASTNTSLTMKKVITDSFWKFLPFIVKKIFYSPKIIINIWQTLFYGNQSDHISSEILILAIDKKFQRRGIGKNLLTLLENELIKRHIYNLKVSTLSTNTSANKFYESTGGKFFTSFNIYHRVWNKYIYYIKKK